MKVLLFLVAWLTLYNVALAEKLVNIDELPEKFKIKKTIGKETKYFVYYKGGGTDPPYLYSTNAEVNWDGKRESEEGVISPKQEKLLKDYYLQRVRVSERGKYDLVIEGDKITRGPLLFPKTKPSPKKKVKGEKRNDFEDSLITP